MINELVKPKLVIAIVPNCKRNKDYNFKDIELQTISRNKEQVKVLIYLLSIFFPCVSKRVEF